MKGAEERGRWFGREAGEAAPAAGGVLRGRPGVWLPLGGKALPGRTRRRRRSSQAKVQRSGSAAAGRARVWVTGAGGDDSRDISGVRGVTGRVIWWMDSGGVEEHQAV